MGGTCGKLVLAGLAAALGLAPLAGCGTTKAATAPLAEEERRLEKTATPTGDAVDALLAREGERWMVEQAKRRAHEQPPPAPAKQGAAPAGAPSGR